MISANDIIARAMSLIDEQLVQFEQAASTEMSVSDMALDILPTVCRSLVKELPYFLKRKLATTADLVVDTLAGGESQTAYTKKKIAFVLPSDFWELVSIKLESWAKPCTDYITPESEEYTIQNNPILRGGKHNPVVAISSNSGFGRIECFSVMNAESGTVSHFKYVSFNNVPNNTGLGWPDELLEATSKALAGELMLIKSRLSEAEISGSEVSKIIEN